MNENPTELQTPPSPSDSLRDSLDWVVKEFDQWLKEDEEIAFPVAAVKALTEVIKRSSAKTMMELRRHLDIAAQLLKDHCHALSVASGCELFTRFVTRISLDIPDFVECKQRLIERGEQYLEQSSRSREKIARIASSFLRDGATILTHGFSRVVLSVLLHAAQEGKRFQVFVTEARPGEIGHMTAQRLQTAKIPITLIMDCSVAHIMDQVDAVLIGAEAIVENGGIINKIGSYQISIVAKALNKPFYVAAESFKFMRLYPLGQQDLKKAERKFAYSSNYEEGNTKVLNPIRDYTPPSGITLLFTELGVLTPSAVSDELIKLYY